MNRDELNRAWYSESRVREIQVPDLDTWRSRYDLKEQLLLMDYTRVIRNLKSNDMIPATSSEDTVHRITGAEEFRPDIIAYQFYKDPRLAWVVLATNGMKDIFEFTADTIITIPSITSLYMPGGVLHR